MILILEVNNNNMNNNKFWKNLIMETKYGRTTTSIPFSIEQQQQIPSANYGNQI